MPKTDTPSATSVGVHQMIDRMVTEEIATNYLNYLPVPGAYEGCITLESVGGKAWAI